MGGCAAGQSMSLGKGPACVRTDSGTPFETVWVDHVEAVPRALWAQCFAPPQEGEWWYRALERSGLRAVAQEGRKRDASLARAHEVLMNRSVPHAAVDVPAVQAQLQMAHAARKAAIAWGE